MSLASGLVACGNNGSADNGTSNNENVNNNASDSSVLPIDGGGGSSDCLNDNGRRYFVDSSFTEPGQFGIQWSVTPGSDRVDLIIGTAPMIERQPFLTDYASMVHFNADGRIDARNGGLFEADTDLYYSAGQSYLVRLEVDNFNSRYSVFVTPPGGQEQRIADSYVYRIERLATMSLSQWAIRLESGSAEVCLDAYIPVDYSPGRDYYIDPLNGSPDGDGSYENPWQSLQAVVDAGLIESQIWETTPYEPGTPLVPLNPGAPIQAGDRILLRDGYHGEINIVGYYNKRPITIAAQDGHQPQVSRINLRAAANWRFRGLQISPEFGPVYSSQPMVVIAEHSGIGPVTDVVVEDCMLRSVEDVSQWTDADWDQLSAWGISTSGGQYITIRNNQLINVDFGMKVYTSMSLVEGNTIDMFAGDGINGTGDYSVFQYNLIKNSLQVNDNHADGFQSWTYADGQTGGGEVHGIVLRGNMIINYDDPGLPYRSKLQGIGCFDGMYVDWLVENNVVVVDNSLGLVIRGATNCRVINNTVLDLNPLVPGPALIRVGPHKNGTPSTDCLVRNNLATGYDVGAAGVSEDHNIQLSYSEYADYFVDAESFDFRLIEGALAVDTGTSELAPEMDITNTPRPQGQTIDLGAYESH